MGAANHAAPQQHPPPQRHAAFTQACFPKTVLWTPLAANIKNELRKHWLWHPAAKNIVNMTCCGLLKIKSIDIYNVFLTPNVKATSKYHVGLRQKHAVRQQQQQLIKSANNPSSEASAKIWGILSSRVAHCIQCNNDCSFTSNIEDKECHTQTCPNVFHRPRSTYGIFADGRIVGSSACA